MTGISGEQPEWTAVLHGPRLHVAREKLDSFLRMCGASEDLIFDATLISQELLTNAYVHAANIPKDELDRASLPASVTWMFGVVHHGDEEYVKIAVTDGGREEPRWLLQVGKHAGSGRGLLIVQRLAAQIGDQRRYGTARLAEGKSVWAEVGPLL